LTVPGTEFRIRTARPHDAPAIADVHYRAIKVLGPTAYPPEIVESWAAGLRPEGYRLHEAQPGRFMDVAVGPYDDPVGFCDYRKGEIVALFTAPEHVRRGIGSALLARAEAVTRAAGVATITLDAALSARLFWIRHGFIPCGEIEITSRGGLPIRVIRMEKTL